jgi:MYXO-CTERM domain-containing protein
VAFFASAGVPTEARTIKIKNGGGGALGAVNASVQPLVPWLSLSGDATSVTLAVKTDALTAGRHQATVRISADGVPGAGVSIPVVVNADESFPAPAADGGADIVAPGPYDAGAPADAAAVATDAGAGTSDQGCSCAVGGAGATARGPAGLVLLVAIAVVIRAHRRERRPVRG